MRARLLCAKPAPRPKPSGDPLAGADARATDAVRTAGLWDDTLILFTADNGGITKGNNHPLRGHKHDSWEGGTRATAFLSGGFLPVNVRGTQCHEKVHVADWCKLLMLSRFAALPSR